MEDLVTDIPLEFDFLFSRSHAEVISGKQEGESRLILNWIIIPRVHLLTVLCCLFARSVCLEGVYAWIGINFVLGRFDHPDEGEC